MSFGTWPAIQLEEARIFRLAVAFKRCSVGIKGRKVCQENNPNTITPLHQPEPLTSPTLSCFQMIG